MFGHIFGLLFNPQSEWEKLASLSDNQIKRLLLFPIVMSVLPPIGFYFGTTHFGWKIISDDLVKLTAESAIPLVILFYFAIIGAIVFVGWMVHWMSATYQAESFPIKGIVLMGYAMTPVFLAGLLAVYPVWWFDLLLATAACSYTIRLIYLGVPSMMKVSEDKGFLYASAVFMLALVYVVAVLVATSIMWEYVATPVFTD